MTDKQNFEKDINVPSKRLDRIDKMEIDLANYEQMERDIEKIIEPYQLDWELDCLSLPSAIQSILERKEQECERLKNERTVDLVKQLDQLKAENEELKAKLIGWLDKKGITRTEKEMLDQCIKTLTEIKEIAEVCQCHNVDGCYECKHFDDCDIEDAEIPTRDVCKLILQKISEVDE